MMHEGYKKYLEVLKKNNMDNPMSEKDWKVAVGIKDEEHISFVSRKSASHRNIEPTLLNHESKPNAQPLKVNLLDHIPDVGKKVLSAKKPKAEKPPRKIMTSEEARIQRNKLKRERYIQKREEMGKPPRKTLTVEEQREYNRTYMKLFWERNPDYQNQANKKWRERNPEKHKAQRERERAARKIRKENLLQSAANGSASKSPEPMSAVA